MPNRAKIASPAHAPRIAAATMSREPAARRAADEHRERGVEDADEHRQHERWLDAHAPEGGPGRARGGPTACAVAAGRAIRPPPRTSSPSYSTAAWPGAAAQTGTSVRTASAARRAG